MPVRVMLDVGCPSIPKPPMSVATISVAVIIALSVIGSLLFVVFLCGGWYYQRNRMKYEEEMKLLAEENDKKVRAMPYIFDMCVRTMFRGFNCIIH
jgi:hypothetical protein